MSEIGEPLFEQKQQPYVTINVLGPNRELHETTCVPVSVSDPERSIEISGTAVRKLVDKYGESTTLRIRYPHAERASHELEPQYPLEVPDEQVFFGGALRIVRPYSTLLIDGKPIKLSLQEYRLLAYLIETPDQYRSRGDIYTAAWTNSVFINPTKNMMKTIDTHVSRSNRKTSAALMAVGLDPPMVRHLKRFGYGFMPSEIGQRE